MPIANFSTSVPVIKTVGEIQEMLAKASVQVLMIDYEGTLPKSITFRMERGGESLHFRLPADWRGVQSVLRRQKGVSLSGCSDEQSQRVSWRIVRDWIRAQLALVETGAAKLEEVMLPYLLIDSEMKTTLYQRFSGRFAKNLYFLRGCDMQFDASCDSHRRVVSQIARCEWMDEAERVERDCECAKYKVLPDGNPVHAECHENSEAWRLWGEK